MKEIPDVDAISLNNIDVLSKWRMETKVPVIEGPPAWLEEEELECFVEGDVPAAISAPPSTQIDIVIPISQHQIDNVAPSSRKQAMAFFL